MDCGGRYLTPGGGPTNKVEPRPENSPCKRALLLSSYSRPSPTEQPFGRRAVVGIRMTELLCTGLSEVDRERNGTGLGVKALFTRCATAISQQSTARYSKMGRRSALARHFLTKGHCVSAAQHMCGGWRQRQPAMTVRIRQQKPLREQLADY